MAFEARLTRRSLFRGGLGVAAGVGLSGCGSALSSGLTGSQLAPGTVTYWNLFSGGDGGRMQTMENGYRKMKGSAPLQAATFSWGNPYYTKVSLATMGGAAPDVAISHLSREGNLATAGLITEVTDDMLGMVGLKPSDFSQKAWETQKVDGKSYCIPLDTHVLVLYYSIDVCQKAGLLDSSGGLKPIRGKQQWEDALKAAQKVTGKYGATIGTVGDSSGSWRWLQTLYSQRDGNTPFLGDDGQKLTYNTEVLLDTLAYIQSLTKSGLMPETIDDSGAESDFFVGKSGFFIVGDWEVTTAEDVKDFKFSMTRIPTIFDKPANQADSHTFVLPRKHRDEAQLQRTLGFIKALLEQSLTWAKGGHIPAYLPVQDSQAYKNLKPQSNYADAANYAVYDPKGWYSGAGSNFENVVGAQVGLVQQGLATPKQAAASMRSQLLAYAKTANPL